MSVILADRPTESVRNEVIDQLVMNYSHGELSYEAFERRLDKAMELACNEALVELTKDLPLSVDKAFVESKKQDLTANYHQGNVEPLEKMVNVFSNNSRKGVWSVPQEIHYLSFFSGTELDFTDAKFGRSNVNIKIISVFSGNTIYVPENVNVVSKAFCIFGGIENLSSGSDSEHVPTIIIEGYSIFSGVSIKIRRSLKEHFVNLADNLKNLFS
jgi:hypothetical protein|tara:strand:+ start:26 stop:667 length:642 start_codon:yes stop_codon:yes gene_type:complete